MTVTISGTTGIAGVDGSAGTPAVQGGDNNTGVFFPAADTVAIATGGTERARVDSSGNVLVGVTSASYSATNRGVINVGGSSGGLAALISGTNKSYLFQSGVDLLVENDTTTGAIIFGTNASTERARIDSSGNLLVGTATTDIWTGSATNTGFKVESNGTTTMSRSGFAALLVKRTTASTGDLASFAYGTSVVGTISTNGTGTTYGTSSDYRLKENVQPMTGALAKVAALKPVTYKWKSDGSDGEGFIAHELQAVVPDCVTGEKDAVDADGKPVYQGIDTSFLVATLTAAIQELKGIVDSQAARIAALEGAAQ
jgi:hypothetical protein